MGRSPDESLLGEGMPVRKTATIADRAASSEPELLDRALSIAPILRAHAKEAERNRKLSTPAFEAMRDAGLYRMWVPEALDGYEVDPMIGLDVIEALSAIDSAAGWNLQISAAMTILPAWLPEAGAREVAEAPYFAGGLFPLGRAEAVDGGYRLTARCPFASGCQQASWLVCQAQVFDGDKPRFHGHGQPVVVWPFFRAVEAEIVDTWRTMGMRGTGSHDVVADGIFVPAERVAHPRPLTDPPEAYGGPLYRLTVWTPVAALAAPALGIARSAINYTVELGNTKTPNYFSQKMGQRPSAQSQVAEATALYEAGRAYLHEAVREAFERVREGELIDQQRKIKIQLATTYAVRAAADAVDLVCRAAGTTSIQESAPLEQCFRDAQVVAKHAYASTARYESVGKLLFGHDTDWAFFSL